MMREDWCVRHCGCTCSKQFVFVIELVEKLRPCHFRFDLYVCVHQNSEANIKQQDMMRSFAILPSCSRARCNAASVVNTAGGWYRLAFFVLLKVYRRSQSKQMTDWCYPLTFVQSDGTLPTSFTATSTKYYTNQTMQLNKQTNKQTYKKNRSSVTHEITSLTRTVLYSNRA